MRKRYLRYFILFNCKNDKNDKKWLYDIFKQHELDVHIIEPKFKMTTLVFMSGILGKIKFIYSMFEQAIRGILKSRSEDVIIVWGMLGGLVVNLLNKITGNRRNVILMNWLTPYSGKAYIKYLQKLAANNLKCKIIVNSIKSEEEWVNFLQIKNKGNFRYIPDVYDTKVSFKAPKIRKEKYVFTGGISNRDWRLITEIAKELPGVKFVCVGIEKSIKKEITESPDNVIFYYEISSEQYYKMMGDATVIALPLKDDRVSGFINITHAAQNGQLCCCTNWGHIDIYYPNERKCDLLANEKEAWVEHIKEILEMKDNEYLYAAIKFQTHVRENFSPKYAFDVLYNCWQ